MLVGFNKPVSPSNESFDNVYTKILEANDIKYKFIDLNDHVSFWKSVGDLTHFIYRFGQTDHEKIFANSFMPVIQFNEKIKCFPDFNTSWHYDNKIAEYYLLYSEGFPVIDSHIFWNKGKALEFIENTSFPMVMKLSGGAGSSNVRLISKKKQAIDLTERLFSKGLDYVGYLYYPYLFHPRYLKYKLYNLIWGDREYWQLQKNYVLFQKFLPGNDFDTRIVVIGSRALGFIRYNRKGDFRASGSGKFNLDPSIIDKECLKIAFSVSERFKFQSMAYDFIKDEDGKQRICEISYTYSFRKPYIDCPGYWDQKLNWHKGKNWPEYYHLIDFLGIPNLRRIEIY